MLHSRALPLLLALLLAATLGGCGYARTSSATGFGPANDPDHAAERAASTLVLAPEYRDLAIGRVDNPTVYVWLEHRLRNRLRDELLKRQSLTLTPKDKATAVMSIDVERFTLLAKVKDEEDVTLRYEADLQLTATVRAAEDGALLWESGPVRERETLDTNESEAAGELVVDRIVRKLADRMTHAY